MAIPLQLGDLTASLSSGDLKAPTLGANKGKKWVKNKYFKRYKGKDWTLSQSRDLNMCQRISRKGEEKSFILYDISSTPMIRHVLSHLADRLNKSARWFNMSATGSKSEPNQVQTTLDSMKTGPSANTFMSATGDLKAPTGGGNKGKTTGPLVLNMFHVALAKTYCQRTKLERPDLWRQPIQWGGNGNPSYNTCEGRRN